MKPIAHSGPTPAAVVPDRSAAAGAAEPPGASRSPPRQRVGADPALASLSEPPRPPVRSSDRAAPQGSTEPRAAPGHGAPGPAATRAEDPLSNLSWHSAATVQHSNARPRTLSFDPGVQVREIDNSLPARHHGAEDSMPLRSVARLESAQRVHRPAADGGRADAARAEPQPPRSRWDDSAPPQGGTAGGLGAPRRSAAADAPGQADRAPVAPARRRDPDDEPGQA